MSRLWVVFMLCLSVSLFTTSVGHADAVRTSTTLGLGGYAEPFYPGNAYRADVQSPSDFFGFALGSRPLSCTEVLRYFTYLDETFANVALVEYARSYEGRALVYLTIASEENAKRLAAIRKEHKELADPRTLPSDAAARAIIDGTPAVAWMAYGIHGDELSSTDASVRLAYQLVAGTDDVTEKIRHELVVCIDPMENPDGRERWLKQVEIWNGVMPNDDVQSLQHRGMWPYGRGNHYLFDINRDWFAQVHPESRGRTQAILQWHPQFVLDCHEMGPFDTYLFSPPREPFNPFMFPEIHKWWRILAEDEAAAFDRHGWEYYTREWNEELFPGYGSSWGIYTGAVGMLYEQAGVDGTVVKRPDGTTMTYRETIHHQFTSSMANLTTVANHRKELLQNYYDEKKRNIGMEDGHRRAGSKSGEAFLFPPSDNAGRWESFAETLLRQDIEVEVATEGFHLPRAESDIRQEVKDLTLPKGTLIVKLNQPLRPLVETILTFDIRIPTDFLETERKEVLKHNDSRLYESTGWSLPLAYNIESYFVEALPKVKSQKYTAPAHDVKGLPAAPAFGYVFANTDDKSMILLAHLLDRGYKVWSARKPFEVAGQLYPPGSFVIRRSGNPEMNTSELDSLSREDGVALFAANTALGGRTIDLGGNEFALLQTPRIAIVGGASVSSYEFGAVWHLLDARVRYKAATLRLAELNDLDLRKYNVIVLPSAWGGDVYERFLGKRGIKKLRDWMKDGGTLVTMGSATAFAADSATALTSVREKHQVIKTLAEYNRALSEAKAAEFPEVDSLDVWEGPEETVHAAKHALASQDSSTAEDADARARKLRPWGTILSVELDGTHWLAFGVRSPAAMLVSTGDAFVAKGDVQVAGRFADAAHLRLSGLLWPEARARWSETVFAAREGVGRGQIVMFAVQPNFRGYFYGGERMLLNALLLGPGFGTRPTLDW
jgi:hypothetical protein